MNGKKIAVASILSFSLALNILLSFLYSDQASQAAEARQRLERQANLERFKDLFLAKVLIADAEVSFQDRLDLENAVRSLGDQEILAQWEAFTGSQDRDSASAAARRLLLMLIGE